MPLGCRNNLSYGRYWEGRSKLQDITANLSDAVRTAINFDRNAVPKEKPTPEQTEQHEWFCDTFVHLISLFHGVALATLRGDYDMENLVVCWCPPPRGMHGNYARLDPPGGRSNSLFLPAGCLRCVASRGRDGVPLTWQPMSALARCENWANSGPTVGHSLPFHLVQTAPWRCQC